jgi:hypothetical protein
MSSHLQSQCLDQPAWTSFQFQRLSCRLSSYSIPMLFHPQSQHLGRPAQLARPVPLVRQL